MPTLLAADTQTAEIDTEHVLATNTDNHTYVLKVDLANLAAGDVVELRLYAKCLTGGTERLAYVATYANVQGEPLKYSPPVPEDISLKATLLQTDGTGRDFPWALLQLD